MKNLILIVLVSSSFMTAAFASTTRISERKMIIKERILGLSGCEKQPMYLNGGQWKAVAHLFIKKEQSYKKYLVQETLNRKNQVVNEDVVADSVIQIDDEIVVETKEFRIEQFSAGGAISSEVATRCLIHMQKLQGEMI